MHFNNKSLWQLAKCRQWKKLWKWGEWRGNRLDGDQIEKKNLKSVHDLLWPCAKLREQSEFFLLITKDFTLARLWTWFGFSFGFGFGFLYWVSHSWPGLVWSGLARRTQLWAQHFGMQNNNNCLTRWLTDWIFDWLNEIICQPARILNWHEVNNNSKSTSWRFLSPKKIWIPCQMK